ncbi:MAG: diacylglycerol kinase family protein [Myxococcota bacterium]
MFTTSSPQPVSESRVLSPQRLSAKRGRVAVLLNANAKRVNERVRQDFARIVPSEDLFFSRSLEEAENIAGALIERRYDVVLAGGGDGTIVQTMNNLIRAADRAAHGMVRPPLPDLGILRLGTGNGLAAACGAKKPIEDTLRVLSGKGPRARPLSLIEEVGGRVFPFASLGYDAQLLNDFQDLVDESESEASRAFHKSLPGYFYALFTRTVPQELKAEKARVRVVSTGRASMLDPSTDEEVPLAPGATLFEGVARAIAMGTTPYYGYELKIFPFAERRSDRFHLRISTAAIPQLLMNLPSLWKGSYRSPDFLDFLVEGVTIESTQPMPYQTAGDARGSKSKLELRLSPRTFRVLDDVERAA